MEATSDTATGTRDGKNVVQVQILGQQLTIRGEADQDYILSVAQYVDRKMREVTEKLPVYSMSKVAILASLHNLAYYQSWMARIRQSIRDGTFADWLADENARSAGLGGPAQE